MKYRASRTHAIRNHSFAILTLTALLLRIVSGLPGIAIPHHHGTTAHTHEAGGLAHHHAAEYDHHNHDRHTHAKPARANAFPIRIAIRWAKDIPRPVPPAPDNDRPATPEDAYFSPAAIPIGLPSAPPALAPAHTAPGLVPDCHTLCACRTAAPCPARAPPARGISTA